MDLFNSSKAAILLKRQSLDYYTQTANYHLEFPPEAISNLEIHDRAKLSESLNKFLADNTLKKQPVLILLSSEVTFEKKFAASQTQRAEIDKFYSEIPLDPTKLAKKEVQIGTETLARATNKELLDAVTEELSKLGWKADLATPLSIVPGLESATSLTSDDLKKIASLESTLRQTNLLSTVSSVAPKVSISPPTEQSTSPIPELSLAKKLLIILIVALLTAGAIIGLTKTGIISTIRSQKSAAPKVKAPLATPPTATSSSAAKEPEMAKKDLTVQILNGTGTAGDAGKVKTALVAIGFEKIETGNYLTQDASDTLITYSASVSATVKEQVDEELKKLFPSVKSQSASESSNFAISIITGK